MHAGGFRMCRRLELTDQFRQPKVATSHPAHTRAEFFRIAIQLPEAYRASYVLLQRDRRASEAIINPHREILYALAST